MSGDGEEKKEMPMNLFSSLLDQKSSNVFGSLVNQSKKKDEDETKLEKVEKELQDNQMLKRSIKSMNKKKP